MTSERAFGLAKIGVVVLALGGIAVSFCLASEADDLHSAREGWAKANSWVFASQNDIDIAFDGCKGETELSCVGLLRGSRESPRPVSFRCSTKGCEFLRCDEGAKK